MGTKKLETYETPSCKVYDLELEAAVMSGSPNVERQADVTHENFTSGGGLDWNSWTNSGSATGN